MGLYDPFTPEQVQGAQQLAHTLHANRGDVWSSDSFKALQESSGVSNGRTLSLATPESLRAGSPIPHITPQQIEDQSIFTRLSGQLNMPRDNWSADDYGKFFYKGEQALQKQIYANSNLSSTQKDKLANGVISKMEGVFGPGFRAGTTTMQDVQSYMDSVERIVGNYGGQVPSGFSDFVKREDHADAQRKTVEERIAKSKEAQQNTVFKHLDESEAARTGSGFAAAQKQFDKMDQVDHLQGLKEKIQVHQQAVRDGVNPDLAWRLHKKKKNDAERQSSQREAQKRKATSEQHMRVAGVDPDKLMTDEEKLAIVSQFETNDRYAPQENHQKTAMETQIDEAANIGGHLSEEEKAGIATQFEKNARHYEMNYRRNIAAEKRKRWTNGLSAEERAHDKEFGEALRKEREDFKKTTGLGDRDFEKWAQSNPNSIVKEKNLSAEGLQDFMGRQRHARATVTKHKNNLQRRLRHIDDRTKDKSFEDLKYQEDGKGFLSKKETDNIMKKSSWRNSKTAHLKDALSRAANKVTFGRAHMKTNRVEDIRNKGAQQVVNQHKGSLKHQIKQANQQLKDINDFREDAIEGGRSKNAIRKYGQAQDRAERKARAARAVNKSKGFGLKGKAGAAIGLLALGGVLGNMMGNGGRQSNAQMYNPNPQPQYYS